ncbi:MAG: hypothetical protein EXS19_01960 [Pedosphaera sp.]|nr:hypothetical protein [Pedosphaera sp.]
MKTPFKNQMERAVLKEPPHAHPELRASQPTSTVHELARRIATHPFGRDLSEEYRLLLARCASEIEFVDGQMVVREGDPANRFYLIFECEVANHSPCQPNRRPTVRDNLASRPLRRWAALAKSEAKIVHAGRTSAHSNAVNKGCVSGKRRRVV